MASSVRFGLAGESGIPGKEQIDLERLRKPATEPRWRISDTKSKMRLHLAWRGTQDSLCTYVSSQQHDVASGCEPALAFASSCRLCRAACYEDNLAAVCIACLR